MAAVTKKFRWTNADGETMEVEIGADGGNVTIDGKPLTEVLDEIVSKAGNVIAESGEITTAPMVITLSNVPVEGVYYFIPPKDSDWDTIDWGEQSFNESGTLPTPAVVNQGQAALIKYNGGSGDTGAGAFDLVAVFPGSEQTEQWDTAAEQLSVFLTAGESPKYVTLKEIEEAIESSRNYSSTPQEIGEWTDGTPIWRYSFNKTLSASEKNTGECFISLPVADENKAFVINAFGQLATMTPCMIDDAVCTYKGYATFSFTPVTGAPYDMIYGYIEFVTPASNIKTT